MFIIVSYHYAAKDGFTFSALGRNRKVQLYTRYSEASPDVFVLGLIDASFLKATRRSQEGISVLPQVMDSSKAM